MEARQNEGDPLSTPPRTHHQGPRLIQVSEATTGQALRWILVFIANNPYSNRDK